jgi:integrase
MARLPRTGPGAGLLFGLPLREHNVIVRHFKPILKRAGLPLSIRLYDLRHSCATVLLEAGTHPKVVAGVFLGMKIICLGMG